MRNADRGAARAAAFPQNLPALTSVRFFLALGVVLFHYQLQWPWDTLATTGLLDRARLGVDAFFILSGFVLTHAYREAIADGRLDYRRFLVARHKGFFNLLHVSPHARTARFVDFRTALDLAHHFFG